jgi:hypothetical protein
MKRIPSALRYSLSVWDYAFDLLFLDTPAVMKRCHWVQPVLVAQINFTEWTSDHQLRQPVFLGLRTDKQPKDVFRE